MPILAVLCAALLFATTGTSQELANVDASPVAVGAARLVFGGLLLASFALSRTFGREIGPTSWPNVQLSAKVSVAVGALAVLAYQPLFFAGTRANGVAVGTVIALGSAPVITGLLAAAIGQGRPTRRWWGATCLALVGIGLLAGLLEPGATLRPTGLLASLGAGASYAVYTLAAKDLIDSGRGSTEVMGWFFGVAAVIALPVLLVAGADWLTTARGLALALWLGVATTAVAYVLFGWGLARLPATTVATLTLAEPFGASVLGVVVLRERLDTAAILGIVLMVVALALLSVGRSAREPAPA